MFFEFYALRMHILSEGWYQSRSSKSWSQVHFSACLSRSATSMVGLEEPFSIRWR